MIGCVGVVAIFLQSLSFSVVLSSCSVWSAAWLVFRVPVSMKGSGSQGSVLVIGVGLVLLCCAVAPF